MNFVATIVWIHCRDGDVPGMLSMRPEAQHLPGLPMKAERQGHVPASLLEHLPLLSTFLQSSCKCCKQCYCSLIPKRGQHKLNLSTVLPLPAAWQIAFECKGLVSSRSRAVSWSSTIKAWRPLRNAKRMNELPACGYLPLGSDPNAPVVKAKTGSFGLYYENQYLSKYFWKASSKITRVKKIWHREGRLNWGFWSQCLRTEIKLASWESLSGCWQTLCCSWLIFYFITCEQYVFL